MKRLSILASYDKDSFIDHYLIYYIKELSKVSDIIYVADNSMSERQLRKISSCCIKTICIEHGGYDFGSYKIGYFYAKDSGILNDYDSLIFCNDSVYGPFFSLEDIFVKMDKKNFDAWSMFHCFQDNIGSEHLQSYFICMNRKIFLSDSFSCFVSSIKKENSKDDYIENYEGGLTEFFKKNKYSIGGYLDSTLLFNAPMLNLPFYEVETVIKNGFPFLKRSLFSESNRFDFTLEKFYNIISFIGERYNFSFITNNISRVLDIKYFLLCKEENINNSLYTNIDIDKSLIFSILNIGSFSILSLSYSNRYIILNILGIKITIKKNIK